MDATPVNDYGSVVLTAGGFSTGSVPYGPGTANPTAASAATALASALSVAGSGYTASANGATGIAVTTSAFSASGNGISISVHGTSADPADFPSASFNVPAASLNGGINPDPSGLSLPLVTQYQYDALGNLLRVDQKGTAPGDSTQWRTRTFTYDSLSRLLTATNPESGTISYVYDADGELLQKTSPAPNQTGAATQTVSYCYDVLHRVTGKGYGAQGCPLASAVASYVYDSGANAIGKLVSLTDQAGAASYSFDTLGRLTAETRTLIGAGGEGQLAESRQTSPMNGSGSLGWGLINPLES